MSYVPVVDVSKHQGTVDFGVMRTRNVDGVIIRAVHGKSIDDRLTVNYRNARAAGYDDHDIGFYGFCNPKRGGGAETGVFFADVVTDLLGHDDTFLMYDVEDYSKESGPLPPKYGLLFGAWLREHQAAAAAHAPGLRHVGYSNRSYWNGTGPLPGKLAGVANVGDSVLAGEWEWIIARYPYYSPAACAAHVPPVDAAHWAGWILTETNVRPLAPIGADRYGGGDFAGGWQFSAGYNGRAHVYGASSDDLDLNIVRTDAWARWTTPTGPPPPPGPVPDPVRISAAIAATGGDMQLRIIADASNKAAPERWVTNGLVRVAGTEHSIDWLTRTMQVVPGQTIRDPEWIDPLELAGIPLVEA